MRTINLAPNIDDEHTAKLSQATRETVMSILDGNSGEQIAKTSAAVACLAPLLSVLSWTGEPRHLQEALPYMDNVEDVEGLRTVLARLNYETFGQKRSMCSLGSDLLPSWPTDDCRLVTGRTRFLFALSLGEVFYEYRND